MIGDKIHRMKATKCTTEETKELCQHCEYGNRYIDLGLCPECKIGRIIGDCHTKALYCSTGLHHITTIGISFCGRKNCDYPIYYDKYEIVITSKLSIDQIQFITQFTDKTPLQIYKAIKQQIPCCENVYFHNMLKMGRFLYDNGISFQVSPELPVLTKFDECHPTLADDYRWVLQKHQ